MHVPSFVAPNGEGSDYEYDAQAAALGDWIDAHGLEGDYDDITDEDRDELIDEAWRTVNDAEYWTFYDGHLARLVTTELSRIRSLSLLEHRRRGAAVAWMTPPPMRDELEDEARTVTRDDYDTAPMLERVTTTPRIPNGPPARALDIQGAHGADIATKGSGPP